MSTVASAFGLLDPKIQEQLYAMRWTELRSIQVASIHSILESDNHLIVSASTAAGKTEAAFLPILSKIVDDCSGGVRALYVGPLKALINDQFQRLELLCESCEIPAQGWHGDVPQSQKARLLKQPGGVLLITPESLESLFINKQTMLTRLFSRLDFIVIDELHAFLGTDRGMHTRSLISRLQQLVKHRIRLVGLSATLGDLDDARKWMDRDNPDSVTVVEGLRGEKAIQYLIKGYVSTRPGKKPSDGEHAGESYEETDGRLVRDVFETFNGKTALIFGNSKSRLEFYADLVKRECARRKLPDRFCVHHGSLSKEERELTEEMLKSDAPTATFCSSTLELGIDVGNVQEVGHLGAPWSVNALAQRLGRSGRKQDEPSVMRVFLEVFEKAEDAPLTSRIYPELLQAIALTELMLERWCEPPDMRAAHLGPLVQQILSVIKEKSGVRADQIFDTLVARGAFSHISQDDFVEVLRSLGEADLIEQAPEGFLMLGLQGEYLTKKLDFYAVFTTPDDYTVFHDSHNIGQLSMYPGDGSDGYVILAGRRWQISSVDEERKEIYVHPAKAGIPPSFDGGAPAPTHPRVHEKMRDVLLGSDIPAYLDSTAVELLNDARDASHSAKLNVSPLVSSGPDTIWFVWAGTRVSQTIASMCKAMHGVTIENDEFAITFPNMKPDSVVTFFRNIDWDAVTESKLANAIPVREYGKFENYLSESLRERALAAKLFDLPSSKKAVEGLLANALPRAHENV